jgi:hypothetical protein
MMTDGEGGEGGCVGSPSEFSSTIGESDCMTLRGCRSKEAQLSYHPRSKERSFELIFDCFVGAGRRFDEQEVPCSKSVWS